MFVGEWYAIRLQKLEQSISRLHASFLESENGNIQKRCYRKFLVREQRPAAHLLVAHRKKSRNAVPQSAPLRSDKQFALEIHKKEIFRFAQLFENILPDLTQGLFSDCDVGIESKLLQPGPDCIRNMNFINSFDWPQLIKTRARGGPSVIISSPSPTLRECRHRSFARRLKAVRWRVIFVVAVGKRPHPLPIRRPAAFRPEDATNYGVVGEHVEVVVVPLPGCSRGGDALLTKALHVGQVRHPPNMAGNSVSAASRKVTYHSGGQRSCDDF